MWSKKRSLTANPKIDRRVQKMARSDLMAWADQAIYSTGRSLTAFDREGDPAFLEEALTGADVLQAIVREIRRREQF